MNSILHMLPKASIPVAILIVLGLISGQQIAPQASSTSLESVSHLPDQTLWGQFTQKAAQFPAVPSLNPALDQLSMYLHGTIEQPDHHAHPVVIIHPFDAQKASCVDTQVMSL